MKRYATRLGLGAAVLLMSGSVLPACSSKPVSDTASLAPPFLETPVAPRPATTSATVAKGKQLYDANCAHCHGQEGRGDGYGAPFLVPPPRDLTAGQFKFRTTAGGLLPTDDDLFRTISRGANGTGMPPWKYLLTDDERWALVEYVKTFDPRFAKAGALKPIPLPDAPGKSRDTVHGKAVYLKMQCEKCHGEDGRGVGPASNAMVDAKGRHVNGRDFTQPGSYRTGWTEREIVRTLETGMNGVPMPSYSGVMSTEEEYDLAAYPLAFGAKGSVTFSGRTVRNYRDFLELDDRFSQAHWLFQHNGGVFLPPWGKAEQWTLSVQHSEDDARRFVDNFEAFARALRR